FGGRLGGRDRRSGSPKKAAGKAENQDQEGERALHVALGGRPGGLRLVFPGSKPGSAPLTSKARLKTTWIPGNPARKSQGAHSEAATLPGERDARRCRAVPRSPAGGRSPRRERVFEEPPR